MSKIADYECENEKCGESLEEIFLDTEEQPEYLDIPCTECGGKMKKSLNFKSNCHRWKHRDLGGL